MSDVSPLPWKLCMSWDESADGVYITDANGAVVYATSGWGDVHLSEANARAIVAVMNATRKRDKVTDAPQTSNTTHRSTGEPQTSAPRSTRVCPRCLGAVTVGSRLTDGSRSFGVCGGTCRLHFEFARDGSHRAFTDADRTTEVPEQIPVPEHFHTGSNCVHCEGAPYTACSYEDGNGVRCVRAAIEGHAYGYCLEHHGETLT